MEIWEVGSLTNPSSSNEIELGVVAPTDDEQTTLIQQPYHTVEIPTDDQTISPSFYQKRWKILRSVWFPYGMLISLAWIIPSRLSSLESMVLFVPMLPVIDLISIMHDKPYHKGVIIKLFDILSPIWAPFTIVVVGAVLSPIAVLFLPLLWISMLFVRLLEFIMNGAAYQNLITLEFYIRLWILGLYHFTIAPGLPIFLAIASHAAPKLFSYEMLPTYTRDFVNYWQVMGFSITDTFKLGTFISLNTFRKPRVQLDSVLELGFILSEAFMDICYGFPFNYLFIRPYFFTQPKLPKILGLETFAWIDAIIFIVIIDNAITMLTHMSVWLLQRFVSHGTCTQRSSDLQKILYFCRRYLMYWGNGMKHCINFILSSLLFLLAWVLYFRFLFVEDTPKPKSYGEFGFWTFLSFLICAIFWMIKTCVILTREASSIYVKFESKILQGGKQLYFLGIIGRHSFDIFNLLYNDELSERHMNGGLIQYITWLRHKLAYRMDLSPNAYYHRETDAVDEWEDDKRLSNRKNDRAKHYLLMQINTTTPIFGIQQAANYFLMAKSQLSVETFTSVILQKLESYKQDDDNRDIEQVLKRLIGEENWNDFQYQLDDYVRSSESISFETRLKAWIEKAHNNCRNLANILSSAKEVTDRYNILINLLIIFVCFIMWLLRTDYGTIKVLGAIFGPLVALNCILQNTCKTMFDGIMFSYVRRVFDVGDLCVIDEKMMEVTAIGVWATTFTKLDTQEEMIYPNMELDKKTIVNHENDFDWKDSLELDVGSFNKGNIKILKQEIEKYLEDDKDRFTPGWNFVEVSATGDSHKLIVYFRHKVNLKNSTFFECFVEKRKRQSEYILEAKALVDRYKMKNQ